MRIALFLAAVLVMTAGVVFADDFVSPLPPKFSDGSQRAFPTAEGYGAQAQGGRGGVVLHVTNLKDRGSGSLRHALEKQSGPRIIVFDVGGIIDLSDNIKLAKGEVTIAGQTAPGDGVCLRGGSINVKASDVIVRHLCIRRGDGPGSSRSVGDGFGFLRAQRSIADHLSVSWSIDEALESWFPGTQDLTVQYSLFYEPLDGIIDEDEGPHGYGPLLGNEGQRQSFHHNIIAHARRRSPLIANVQDVDVINNIIFNWKSVATHIFDRKGLEPSRRINVINNVYRPGLNSSGPELAIRNAAAAQVYFGGNQDQAGRPIDSVHYAEGSSYPDALAETPNPRPDNAAINIEPAEDVWNSLPEKAGARVPLLDEADALLIRQIRDGSGTLIDCVDREDQAESLLKQPCKVESALGRFPLYRYAARPADFDTDGDGMPNDWEVLYGLDPDNPGDRAGDMVGDGWTNVEYYLNQLAGDYRKPAP